MRTYTQREASVQFRMAGNLIGFYTNLGARRPAERTRPRRSTMSDLKKFLLVLVPVLAANCFLSLDIYRLSLRREKIKEDYSQINSLRYGLLSADAWKERLRSILAEKIGDFKLSKGQETVLRDEISKALNALVTEADKMLRKHQKTFSGKMKKLALRALINTDDIRRQVPGFTQGILNELEKPAHQRKFRGIARSGGPGRSDRHRS